MVDPIFAFQGHLYKDFCNIDGRDWLYFFEEKKGLHFLLLKVHISGTRGMYLVNRGSVVALQELIILPFWQRPAEIGEIISITSGPSTQISSLSKVDFNR